MQRTTTVEKYEKEFRGRLAYNLARLRTERAFSLEQIEERSGIHLRDLKRIEAGSEAGEGKLTVTTIALLANALLVEPVELVARVNVEAKTV